MVCHIPFLSAVSPHFVNETQWSADMVFHIGEQMLGIAVTVLIEQYVPNSLSVKTIKCDFQVRIGIWLYGFAFHLQELLHSVTHSFFSERLAEHIFVNPILSVKTENILDELLLFFIFHFFCFLIIRFI